MEKDKKGIIKNLALVSTGIAGMGIGFVLWHSPYHGSIEIRDENQFEKTAEIMMNDVSEEEYGSISFEANTNFSVTCMDDSGKKKDTCVFEQNENFKKVKPLLEEEKNYTYHAYTEPFPLVFGTLMSFAGAWVTARVANEVYQKSLKKRK